MIHLHVVFVNLTPEIANCRYLRQRFVTGVRSELVWNQTLIIESRAPGPTAVAHHGDRITAVAGMVLYFTENAEKNPLAGPAKCGPNC